MEKLNTLPLEAEYDLSSNALWVEKAQVTPQVRTAKEMADVLFDQFYASKAQPTDKLYYMFRDVHRKQDAGLLARHSLRYDVTTVPPRTLGRELIKTYGHYHPLAPGSKHAFPELYEVVAGSAWFVLQKRTEGSLEVEDFVVVQAHAGQKVLMPPDYGHLTINPSATETLVMANLVEANFKSNYLPYKERRGGAYYALADGSWVPNPSYANPPKPKVMKADEFWGNAPVNGFKGNIYAEFLSSPEPFSFLRKPDEIV